MYEHWTVVATDFLEADARAYVRYAWKDMTPHSVALTLREFDKRYKDLNDEEFESLWYRPTRAEFESSKEEFLEKEKEEAEAAKIADEKRKEEMKAIEEKIAAEKAAKGEA